MEDLDMTEELIRELIEKIKDKAYIPNDWYGVSEGKAVSLSDVIDVLNECRPKDKYWC